MSLRQSEISVDLLLLQHEDLKMDEQVIPSPVTSSGNKKSSKNLKTAGSSSKLLGSPSPKKLKKQKSVGVSIVELRQMEGNP